MIRALNGLRREMGLPTVPTITGTRAASRECRKRWRMTLAQARYQSNRTMEHYLDLEACPDALLGEPNARELGRFVRMAQAVRAGFEAPIKKTWTPPTEAWCRYCGAETQRVFDASGVYRCIGCVARDEQLTAAIARMVADPRKP